MPKKPTAWQVFYIGGKKRRELGIVYAEDEQAAIDEAMRVHKIPETGRNRVAVERW